MPSRSRTGRNLDSGGGGYVFLPRLREWPEVFPRTQSWLCHVGVPSRRLGVIHCPLPAARQLLGLASGFHELRSPGEVDFHQISVPASCHPIPHPLTSPQPIRPPRRSSGAPSPLSTLSPEGLRAVPMECLLAHCVPVPAQIPLPRCGLSHTLCRICGWPVTPQPVLFCFKAWYSHLKIDIYLFTVWLPVPVSKLYGSRDFVFLPSIFPDPGRVPGL